CGSLESVEHSKHSTRAARRSGRGRAQARNACEVVRGGNEDRGQSGLRETAPSRPPEVPGGLHPTKDLLDHPSYTDAHGVASRTGRSSVDRRASPLVASLRDVRCDPALSTGRNEISNVVACVGGESATPG